MHPNIEESSAIDQNSPLPYSLSLGIKEFGFLTLILFLGFTGFSLCLDKIYAMPDAHKIDEITVHTPVVSPTENAFVDLEG